MRFLKNKILRAQEAQRNRILISASPSSITNSNNIIPQNIILPIMSSMKVKSIKGKESQLQEPESSVSLNNMRKGCDSTKNIAVNYARAIASFAVSKLAVSYLETRLQDEILTIKEFVNYINREKNKMGGICSFRARLLVKETDSAKVATGKRVFQWIAEVFIKYFSVNWIIHGKLANKEIYLKFRFRMLRRVRNPEKFTYIKERKLQSVE